MTSSFEKVKNAAVAALPGAGSFFQNAQPGPADIIAESAGVKAKASMSTNSSQYLTSNFGQPWPGDGQHALNVGGLPVIDPFTFEKQQTFDREKQLERRVHADGAGVFGTFEVTHDVSHLTKAAFLSEVGKSTPLFARFSTVTYEKGYPDLARNPRGMALKFYTEAGNYDIVGLNYPVFFNSDPAIGPDVIRSQSRNPHTGLLDYDACLDLLANVPESMHAGTMFFSDASTPDGFKHHGYGCHAFTWTNENGKRHYIKYTFLRKGGQKFLTMEEAMQRAGWRPDYSKEELFSQVKQGGDAAPTWDVYVQVMDVADSAKYDFAFDVTKVWPRDQFPLQPVGRIVLNKLPEDQHRDVELAAFSPGSFVPGIESSPDPLLQYRIWFYRDAQYYRFGSANIHQIPVNCPFMAQQYAPISKAGNMRVDKDGVEVRPYHPNSYDKPTFSKKDTEQPYTLGDGIVSRRGRFRTEGTDATYDQVRVLYRKVMSLEQQESLHKNTAWWMSQPAVQNTTRIKYLAQLKAIDEAYYNGVLQKLEPTVRKELDLGQVEALTPHAASVSKDPESLKGELSALVGLDIASA